MPFEGVNRCAAVLHNDSRRKSTRLHPKSRYKGFHHRSSAPIPSFFKLFCVFHRSQADECLSEIQNNGIFVQPSGCSSRTFLHFFTC